MSRIYLMSIGKKDSLERMNKNLLNPVPKSLFATYLTDTEMADLNKIYSEPKVPVWGFVPGSVNMSTWKKLEPGDFSIFVPSATVLLVTKVTYKVRNENLAKALWGNDLKTGETWELVFFVKMISVLQLNKRDLLNSIGYNNPNDKLQGHRDVTERFIPAYGSIYDFVERYSVSEVPTELLSQEYTDNLIDSIISRKDERLNELKQKLEASNASVEFVEIHGIRIKRNQVLVKYIKEKADYKCQACGFTFVKRDGSKYVEAAHIKPLAASRLDVIENMVALCPNCHKKLDIGNDEAKKQVLAALSQR
ncbi:MAG: HNH endonuclease [Candidatus Parvarchaeum sp.]